jgi:GNAT superfamily N-acetyltransferase
MDGNNAIFFVCRIPEDMKASQDAGMAILEGLGNHITEHLGNVVLEGPSKIFIRNQKDEVGGGVIGNCFGGWMYISILWVENSLRHQGYGTRLMQLVKSKATQMGYTEAHVDTYSFEARPFYEKLGYELFATLEDYPQGY